MDGEAKRVLDWLWMVQRRTEQDRMLSVVRMPPTRWRRSEIKVSGDLFERWLLKTTINLAMMGQPPRRGGIFGPTVVGGGPGYLVALTDSPAPAGTWPRPRMPSARVRRRQTRLRAGPSR
jgi:hypothetical protein